ncbi:hypothetical protein [Spirillospora sp. CA-294931]|uniref:hypothetical protein n=1 Tax=Spirillospora sp. CA-294931 TaxID=3240042 RepID=UPI003D941394
MNLTTMGRASFLAAPACMLAYGLVRILDGRDGHYGPGTAWTVGHFFFLFCLMFYGVVLLELRAKVPGRAADLAAAVGLVGLVAFVRVAVVDIVVGLRADDPVQKKELARRFADDPDFLPRVVYDVGPLLFEVGLFVLLLRIALVTRAPRWAAGIVALGFVLVTVNLDLLPLGALLIWIGLVGLNTETRGQRWKVRR